MQNAIDGAPQIVGVGDLIVARNVIRVLHFEQLKERALGFKRATKKSELLRAGLQALATLEDRALQAMLDKLTAIKAGRPKKQV